MKDKEFNQSFKGFIQLSILKMPEQITPIIDTQVNENKVFFIVLARDRRHVRKKIEELNSMHVPFVVVCGERVRHPNIVYREAFGKWDAINFGAKFIPSQADVVVMNDVDTKIHCFERALQYLDSKTQIVYCRVEVSSGPQVKFYRIANPIRTRFHIFASGELLIVKRKLLEKTLPVPPCIAEDSYILFKALELGSHAHFCTEAFVTTKRTANSEQEVAYKGRTTLGIYQALSCTKPTLVIRVFYLLLPVFSPLLSIVGRDGVAWAKGIKKAVKANVTKEHPTKF
ncbi:MAG: hypothetical protein NWF01_00100 [Candidatus Bathyarchaeota archaeon]|nr:hypothetical protein [Candidatus Bathyarchaeota archaeon]